MKKAIITLFLCLLTIGVVFTLCACNGQNEEGNTKAPSWADEENECQHKEWKLVGSLEATCENEGYTCLECLECKENKLLLFPQEPCDYEVSWEWGDQAHATIIKFKCPRTNAHNQVKTAFQQSSTVIKEATCQEDGERLCYAEVRDKYGRIHTAEKIEKFKAGCSMVSEIMIPETCFGAGKIINACKWCDKEEISTFRGGHTDVKEVERYNLADYGYCGGSLVRYECQCGDRGKTDYLHTCNMEVLDIIIDNDGVLHQVLQECKACGFRVMDNWKDTVWQLEHINRIQQIRDEQGSCDGECDWDECCIDMIVPFGYQDLFLSQSYHCAKCDTEITLMGAINDDGEYGILCCYTKDEYEWYPDTQN